ncbi:MAG: GMC family oxidoreductase [Desulfobacterales bacterium]|nr:GMC family oxidoreductase [Desulfobacterales bacterium]
MQKEYDVIVVGSGVGGATVAREMVRKGKSVLMLERGGHTRFMGNTLTMAFILKRFGLTRSREKYSVIFGNNYGGLSNLSAGCAVPPPKQVFDQAGIDLTAETEEARQDLWVQTLPDELVGETNLRLLEAANDAGYNWAKMENFIDAQKCREGCGDCMLGCKTGAKWSARVFGDEAVANGAELKLHTTVTRVLTDNRNVIGVEAARYGFKTQYFSKAVVLSAGMNNVHILRAAGIHDAGNGFCCDWLQFVGGIIPGVNAQSSNPMTVGSMEHYEADGLVVLPVFPNWAQFSIILCYMGIDKLTKITDYWKYTGLMVKIQDETAGKINSGLSFSKPVTATDRKKLNKGVAITKRILKQAGARDDSLITLKPSGAHPSATCRIGEVVDNNLETEIKHLFCCDASVFPSALGTPTVWTSVALGKRLANYMDTRLH